MVEIRTPLDLTRQAFEGAAIGGVIIGVQGQRVTGHYFQERAGERGHALLDRLGIRASEGFFELGTVMFLSGAHRSLAPQRAVGQHGPAVGRFVEARLPRRDGRRRRGAGHGA